MRIWPRRQSALADTPDERFGHQDWLGKPMVVGSRIVWPCDAYGNTKQMAVGTVVELRENGLTVAVERRSRTGVPNRKYDRVNVHLTAVGMANATVVA